MGKTYRREKRNDKNKKKSRMDRNVRKRFSDEIFEENDGIFRSGKKTKYNR